MYGDLQDIQSDVNDEVKMRVDKINCLAQDLATVNKQINVIEITGTTANELRDKRDTLVDELSAIVDVDVTENPIYDKDGVDTGATRYIVKIAGGQTLVDQNDYNQLECVARTSEEKVNQTDVDGLYDIYWDNGTSFGLTNSSMGGELSGLLQMRDGNNSEYFTGTATSVTYGPEVSTVTIKTTSSYLQNMDQCNLSDSGGIINIGDQLYYFTDWSYDGNGTYTFQVDNEKSDEPLTSGKLGSSVSIGSKIDYEGIPYYMKQMNEWLRGFSREMNEIFTAGVTADGEDAGILLTGNYTTDDGQYTELELNDIKGNGKGYYYLTAGNFAVEDNVEKDASLLGTRSDATNGVEECEQVKKAITMLTDKNQFSFRGRDAGGFLECVLSDAALNASNANTLYDTYLSLETSIENQRTSISGVDEDEEAVNLVKYQNSYTLASKMISVLTEVYDRLILETGV
jgi:flagellar hook-associated protein 1 FlgK